MHGRHVIGKLFEVRECKGLSGHSHLLDGEAGLADDVVTRQMGVKTRYITVVAELESSRTEVARLVARLHVAVKSRRVEEITPAEIAFCVARAEVRLIAFGRRFCLSDSNLAERRRRGCRIGRIAWLQPVFEIGAVHVSPQLSFRHYALFRYEQRPALQTDVAHGEARMSILEVLEQAINRREPLSTAEERTYHRSGLFQQLVMRGTINE